MKLSSALLAALVASVSADLRFSSKEGNGFQYRQKNVPPNTDRNGNPITTDAGVLRYEVPGTFGYDALEDQKEDNNDNFLRSNVDNEANQRNAGNEAARDMTPCRSETNDQVPMNWQRGETIQMPLRWNNPHDSDCEINLFTNGMTQTAAIRKPFNCGGGYQNNRFAFTMPMDVPGCETAAEGCVMQFYGHSVETRTYIMCVKFVLDPSVPAENATAPAPAPAPAGAATPAAAGAATPAAAGAATPAAGAPSPAPAAGIGAVGAAAAGVRTIGTRRLQNGTNVPATTASETTTVFKPAIMYWDSYDTSHVDSDYSGYRGQQRELIRDELAAAIELRSYVGNGGLVPVDDPLQNARDDLKDEVDDAIKAAEKEARRANKKAQRALNQEADDAGTDRQCFEGELYGVVNNENCNRQYTNTYVTNVGYRAIAQEFAPKFAARNLDPYSPKLKDQPLETPDDPIGQYKRNGKPSQKPKN